MTNNPFGILFSISQTITKKEKMPAVDIFAACSSKRLSAILIVSNNAKRLLHEF